MYVNIVNRKTGQSTKIKFKDYPLLEIKRLSAAALASASRYFVSLIAESADEIDFIGTHFVNLPLPDIGARQAIWTGDLATFAILNYPLSEK